MICYVILTPQCLLCRCINNAAPTFPSNFKHALESFDVNEDGLIDYAEFLEIERRYPIILFPAFRLQDVMQKNSLGKKVCMILKSFCSNFPLFSKCIYLLEVLYVALV